jgi:hypothetical protein
MVEKLEKNFDEKLYKKVRERMDREFKEFKADVANSKIDIEHNELNSIEQTGNFESHSTTESEPSESEMNKKNVEIP